MRVGIFKVIFEIFNFFFAVDEFDLLLRNTLCVADFNALRVEELTREKEATERFISTLTAENKQIKVGENWDN